MKRMLLMLSGPIAVGLLFLLIVYRLGKPVTTMFLLTVLSFLLAITVAFFAVRKQMIRPPTFPGVAMISLIFSFVLACSFAVFWATAEEFFIYFKVLTEPSIDMPGMERYLYGGNSGGGFARGLPELHRSLWDATITAVVLAILWTPISFLLLAIFDRRKGKDKSSTTANPLPMQ